MFAGAIFVVFFENFLFYSFSLMILSSVLRLIKGHDVIINESLKSHYLPLYVGDLIVFSRTLLNSIPYLRILMKRFGWDWLS